jgi:hypothetical protein
MEMKYIEFDPRDSNCIEDVLNIFASRASGLNLISATGWSLTRRRDRWRSILKALVEAPETAAKVLVRMWNSPE